MKNQPADITTLYATAQIESLAELHQASLPLLKRVQLSKALAVIAVLSAIVAMPFIISWVLTWA